MKWLSQIRRVAERRDSTAAFVCGVMAEEGWDGHPDLEQAERWYREAADLPLAQYGIARMLSRKKEDEAAIPWAEKAANAGIPEAATFLSTLYLYGADVMANEQRSADWLAHAKAGGDPDAFGYWALKLVNVDGTIDDPKCALVRMQEAVDRGYLPCTAHLARLYFEHCDPQRIKEGMRMLEKAAGAGDYGSILMLEGIYRYGQFGQDRDKPTADELRESLKFIKRD